MDELKPCPFCGQPVSIFFASAAGKYYVVHKDEQHSQCILTMPLSINNNRLLLHLSDAYNVWNRRAEQ